MDRAHRVGKKLNKRIDNAVNRLSERLGDIEMLPEIPDDQIKQAILELSPAGMQKLVDHYGRDRVLKFIGEFSEGREW